MTNTKPTWGRDLHQNIFKGWAVRDVEADEMIAFIKKVEQDAYKRGYKQAPGCEKCRGCDECEA